MRNTLSGNYAFLVLLVIFFGLTGKIWAAPEAPTPSVISMKSPALFVINEHEVASEDLIKALKKNKIPTASPLLVEIPANTPRNVIENLSQRLASAGYKPIYKFPRHAEASVIDPKVSSPITSQERQSWRK